MLSPHVAIYLKSHSSQVFLQLSTMSIVRVLDSRSGSEQSNATCVDDKKTTAENFDVVDHLRRGAERVADVDELVEIAVKSFKMVGKWYEERSACVHLSLAI